MLDDLIARPGSPPQRLLHSAGEGSPLPRRLRYAAIASGSNSTRTTPIPKARSPLVTRRTARTKDGASKEHMTFGTSAITAGVTSPAKSSKSRSASASAVMSRSMTISNSNVCIELGGVGAATECSADLACFVLRNAGRTVNDDTTPVVPARTIKTSPAVGARSTAFENPSRGQGLAYCCADVLVSVSPAHDTECEVAVWTKYVEWIFLLLPSVSKAYIAHRAGFADAEPYEDRNDRALPESFIAPASSTTRRVRDLSSS